jgi:hypothetical protein
MYVFPATGCIVSLYQKVLQKGGLMHLEPHMLNFCGKVTCDFVGIFLTGLQISTFSLSVLLDAVRSRGRHLN